jgi:Tripartite tricarboxylate transporter family receptor
MLLLGASALISVPGHSRRFGYPGLMSPLPTTTEVSATSELTLCFAAPRTDLFGGQVQVYFAPISASLAYVKAGKFRMLGVTTAARARRCRMFLP